MGEKKKLKNKQNFIPIKKTTLQQINYTQQLHIPTFNTIQVKNTGKSIELKKQNSLKKPVSRKSRCGSVKQTCTSVKQSTTGPIKFKQLLKQFDQLKGLQEKAQKSKSKSAKQIRETIKSRSPTSNSKIKQTNSKKFNLNTLMNKTLNKVQNSKTEFNSRMSLTNKLQKTIKKMNQNEYFYRDQDDSLIPFISTSDACNNDDLVGNKSYEISSQQLIDDDFINLGQMRKFCRTKQNEELFQTVLKKNINYFRGDQYEMMATKIQRAWRRFRTKKLVDRYADVFSDNYVQQVSSHQQSSQYFHVNQQNDLRYENVNKIINELNVDLTNKQNQSYGDLMNEEIQINSQQQQNEQNEQKQSQQQLNNSFIENDSELIETSELFYQNKQQDQHLITYISNLQDEESMQKQQTPVQTLSEQPKLHDFLKNYPIKSQKINENQCDKLISQIKKMELQKWKEVIELLQESKKQKNPLQFQILLNTLQRKSQKNKKELEEIQKDQILTSSNRRSDNQTFEQKTISKRQQSGPSETSDLKKEEEFDSRKYIQYLDSDMFMMDKQKSSQNSQLFNDERFGKRISIRKQKQLLACLDIGQAPIRLKSHCFSKSQNLSYLMEDLSPYVPPVSHRLSKSISQKYIEQTIKSLSPQLQFLKNQNESDQLNLQLIRQQFLENADPIEELQKLHTNHELRMKIKQSLNLNEMNQFEDQSSDEQNFPPPRINIDLSRTFDISAEQKLNQNKISNYLERGQLNIKANKNKQQNNGQISFFSSNQNKNSIIIQNIDKTIQQESQKYEENNEQENQKAENVSFMIYNTLILEVLRQIANYDSILQKFKQYSLSFKNQQQKQIKKGFQTNHTEVKNYVQGLIYFLLNQQPQVFKHLEISAGPTALQMLHYMHPNQCDDEMENDSNISQDETSVMVIPNRMFDKYWTVRQKNLKFDIQTAQHITQQRKKKVVDELKNLTKMFYRSIFDTFNECLDIERNYGQAGKPYPWKKTPSFHHTKTLPQIQKSIQNGQKRMTEIATTYCGLIIQKNQMARISMEGSDDYIQHVQQDRMSRMLAQDLIQGEQRWTFYDDEELELLVQIGNFITISLVLQAGEQISCLINS